ncbi:MAG: hypothetical protein KatS3mg115_2597 [Candidatus Poribacteria bacterium]|nr:MAG: hypothetical protein KatS3mg115_2597 [Candidatus Poribacteria bacterium]
MRPVLFGLALTFWSVGLLAGLLAQTAQESPDGAEEPTALEEPSPFLHDPLAPHRARWQPLEENRSEAQEPEAEESSDPNDPTRRYLEAIQAYDRGPAGSSRPARDAPLAGGGRGLPT